MRPGPSPLSPQWFHVLLALADQDRHGFDILHEVGVQTRGRLRIWPGALFKTLQQMLEEELILETAPPPGVADSDARHRYYSLSVLGRQVLVEEVKHLASYVEIAWEKKLLDSSF